MWSLVPAAEAELVDAVRYISERNPRAGRALLERVLRTFDRLAEQEFEGRLVAMRDGKPVRRWPVPPLVVFYDRSADGVVILRIRHSARRPTTR